MRKTNLLRHSLTSAAASGALIVATAPGVEATATPDKSGDSNALVGPNRASTTCSEAVAGFAQFFDSSNLGAE